MATRKNQGDRPENRRKEATTRQEERAARSPQQQLDRLDSILGEGVGAKKERARLTKQINQD